jgi:hypothetical protein
VSNDCVTTGATARFGDMEDVLGFGTPWLKTHDQSRR